MATKKSAKKGGKKGGKKAGRGRAANSSPGPFQGCNLPSVCAFLTELASEDPNPARAGFVDPTAYLGQLDSYIRMLMLAVSRLELNVHFGDTSETGPAFSVITTGGGDKTPPPPPPCFP